ncbi:MAG TPA: EthD family reductase [Candidatus Acidoferrales bacterium]|jgi:uncharacterized protein (TIGR02118 family)|nr:EthD family reductase [Candidatus Acidoferrales bacterium]
MTRILVLYNQPSDPAAFDRYYFATHVPLAKTIPGLRAYTVNSGSPVAMAGNQPPYLIAELDFDSMADMQSAMASPEGQATAADVANFAHTGATILAFDIRTV